MTRQFYAHSLPERPVEEWQLLSDHLWQVAELAQYFAKGFNGADWAYLAGLWHDFGKYSDAFQNMLFEANKPDAEFNPHTRVDHSSFGARHAESLWRDVGKLIAYVIAGHHSGLPDGKNSSKSDLVTRLSPEKKIPAIACRIPADLLEAAKKPTIPFQPRKGRVGFQLSFFVRMLFSCLVDADFLDTEAFVEPSKAKHRENIIVLSKLRESLLDKLKTFKPDTDINKKRAAILDYCIQASAHNPGLFTLAVPTGGGKTLSSLAFALRHAEMHNKDRVIYVIPFTSIIEQNAAVFRSILGEGAVLEHHSNYTFEKSQPNEEIESVNDKRHRMACENWDAPLIVTTNVQFFDSLFANRTSKCRKLHNISNSVIILDEAQMLPVPYLLPCIETLKELTLNYNCSVVLCTATQPALAASADFPSGFPINSIKEIIPEPEKLHKDFERTRLHPLGAVSNDRMAEEIESHKSVLCIVNTRQRAADLYQLVNHMTGAFHLSARMCPAHRTQKLNQIRESLDGHKPCRVVSTQLVEAGVDLDFPTVYREMAGLDSIAQAAGRCNRNARRETGDVFVFLPEDGRIPKMFRRSAAAADSVIRRFDDPFAPEAIEHYFRQVYWLDRQALDKKQILRSIECGVHNFDLPFKQIAEKFHLIESDMVPVAIPWDEKAAELIRKLEFVEYPGGILRQLQPYNVQIYTNEFSKLKRMGAINMIQGRYATLVSLTPFYSPDFGLTAEPDDMQPEDLIF